MCQASFVSILLLRFNKMEASTPELADSKQALNRRGRLNRKDGEMAARTTHPHHSAYIQRHSALEAKQGQAWLGTAQPAVPLIWNSRGRAGVVA